MTSLTGLQKLYDTEGVSSIAIYLKDRNDLKGFYKDFNAKLKEQGIPLQALPFYDEKISPFYVGVTQFIFAAASLFLILVSLVVVISLANTMSMAVVERTREIGTMRSIGYLPSHVTRLFMIEGSFLIGLGLGFGLILNFVVSYLVNNFTNFRFAPPGISGDAQFLVITNMGVSAFLAVVFLLMGLAAVVTVVRRRTEMAVAQLFQGI
jgi:putative ABC transport system permease protein